MSCHLRPYILDVILDRKAKLVAKKIRCQKRKKPLELKFLPPGGGKEERHSKPIVSYIQFM